MTMLKQQLYNYVHMYLKKIGIEVELVGGMHTAVHVIESAWEWMSRTIY